MISRAHSSVRVVVYFPLVFPMNEILWDRFPTFPLGTSEQRKDAEEYLTARLEYLATRRDVSCSFLCNTGDLAGLTNILNAVLG